MKFRQGHAFSRQDDCRHLDSRQAQRMVEQEQAVILDVREPHEYAYVRIPDSVHIPLRRIGSSIEALRNQGSRPIIISCRSGNRSQAACRFLREQGLENVYNLSGGIIAWSRDNGRLEQ